MAYWLFKQEPSTYSYSQLESDRTTVWDGVRNNLALKHLRSVRKGDKMLFYHTGEEKQTVGIMEIISDPCTDTKYTRLFQRSTHLRTQHKIIYCYSKSLESSQT